ncbi:MAG: outer membrane beta-barrel protein [Bacteroidales bacterium]
MQRLILFLLSFLIAVPAFCQKSLTGSPVKRIIRQVVSDKNNKPVPDVVAILRRVSDTSKIAGHYVTRTDGSVVFSAEKGTWLITYSCLGYKDTTESFDVAEITADTLVIPPIQLKDDAILLQSLVVQGNRHNYGIDHTSITFSPEQVKSAGNARELMLNVPLVIVNKISNSLSTVNGNSILILINGVVSTDRDLLLIPSRKIIKADYYDVPPVRYANSKKVLNVTTKSLDSGFSGDIYSNVTGFFQEFTPYFSYIKGNNKLTIGYNLHINKTFSGDADSYDDVYIYHAGSDRYKYMISQREKNWGNQNDMSVGYTNAKEDSYTFQAKINLGFATDNDKDDRDITSYLNDVPTGYAGLRTNHVRSFSPKLDLYFSKNLDKKTTIDANVVATHFHNKQTIISTESSASYFEDVTELSNNKNSLIGEFVYTRHQNRYLNISAGYRNLFSWMYNDLSSSIASTDKSHYFTQLHSIYSEITGTWQNFSYRASLSDIIIINRNDGYKEHQNIFSPTFLIGRRLTPDLQLRFEYSVSPSSPLSSQLTNSRVYIMSNIVKDGNPLLKSEKEGELSMKMDYTHKYFDVSFSCYLDKTDNSIFYNYHLDTLNNSPVIVMRPENALKNRTFGISTDLSVHPNKAINVGVSIEGRYQSFKPVAGVRQYNGWYFPISLFLSYKLKSFTFNYYQKFKSRYLENLYIKGIEKVSYLSLSYSHNEWEVGISYYFPFNKDDYKNKTTTQSLVIHNTNARLMSKERTLGFSFSWNFHSGSKLDAMKNLNNADEDAGTFITKH